MARINIKFESKARGKETGINVVVPEKQYEGAYKCLYLLHGLGDDENTWLEIYTDSDRIVIVTDKGEKELMVRNGHIKVRLRKVKFAYVKICKKFGKLGLIRAISNPIYFK